MIADPGLRTDLRAALGLWRGNLTVPLLYLLIGALYAQSVLYGEDKRYTTEGGIEISITAGTLVTLAFLLHIGMSGTSRLWYARRVAGQSMTLGEALHYARRYFWRFFGLGFLFGLLALAVGLALSLTLAGIVPDNEVREVIASFAGVAVADVAFTFATPMLALVHPRSLSSVSLGRELARRTRARSYTCLPPLALAATAVATPDLFGRPVAAAVALAALPLTLLFAGATTLFFLRHQAPAGPEGSLGPKRVTYPGLTRQA